MTGSMTASISTSFSNSPTITNSNTVSNSWSYTMTGSNSMLRYYAPRNIMNVCPNQIQKACFTWDRSIGGVTYDHFQFYIGIDGDSYNCYYTIKSSSVVVVGLQQNTQYYYILEAFAGTMGSAISQRQNLTTAPDFRNGVNTLICGISNLQTVECSWNNGKNVYDRMRVSLFCPYNDTIPMMKQSVRDAQTSVVLSGVPSGVQTCLVSFKIRYQKFKSQTITSYACVYKD